MSTENFFRSSREFSFEDVFSAFDPALSYSLAYLDYFQRNFPRALERHTHGIAVPIEKSCARVPHFAK